MLAIKKTLSFGAAENNKSCTFYDNGFIKSIVLTLPDFATAASATKVEVLDDDGDTIYSNTTGWLEDATHLITSISVPLDKEYTLKVTLNDVAGTGGGDATVKIYLNTQE